MAKVEFANEGFNIAVTIRGTRVGVIAEVAFEGVVTLMTDEGEALAPDFRSIKEAKDYVNQFKYDVLVKAERFAADPIW